MAARLASGAARVMAKRGAVHPPFKMDPTLQTTDVGVQALPSKKRTNKAMGRKHWVSKGAGLG